MAVVFVLGATTGCGEDDVARDRLQLEQIQAERRDAARDARQAERLEQVERELREAKRQAKGAAGPQQPNVTTDTSRSSTSDDSWPAGRSAWTVILISAGARDEAEQVAARAVAAGLPQVGVLYSSNYSSLHDGYWVAYTGVLDSQRASGRQAEARAAGFGDAYARQVTP